MASIRQVSWPEFLKHIDRRNERLQVAALCFRTHKRHGKQVLLITSRDTGRWVLPKGWPKKNLDAVGAAIEEAWEEAGVVPDRFDDTAMGSFCYTKRLADGAEVPCRVAVFPVNVARLERNFPERAQRRRKWFSPKKAARRVDEDELRKILKSF